MKEHIIPMHEVDGLIICVQNLPGYDHTLPVALMQLQSDLNAFSTVCEVCNTFTKGMRLRCAPEGICLPEEE